MAIIWADNFQAYGSTTYINDGIYSEAEGNIQNDPDPNISTDVLSFNNFSVDEQVRFALPVGPIATGGVSMKVYMPALPTSGYSSILTFKDISNSAQVTIGIGTTGAITAFLGSTSGTVLGTTAIPVVTASAWHHIETKVTIDNSAGAVEVRVNGVPRLTLSSIDTQVTANASYAQIGFANNTSAEQYQRAFDMKDLVVWDTTGTENNDFLGSVSVFNLAVDGDSSLNWTPSTGSTGFDLINEQESVNDADYISASDALPAASVFTVENLPPDITSIKALIPVIRAAKTC